jgi:DNA-directed RNA polymerase subunit RPC12/RpoP
MSDEQIIANALNRLRVVCVRCGARFLPSTARQMRCPNCQGKMYPVRQKEAAA